MAEELENALAAGETGEELKDGIGQLEQQVVMFSAAIDAYIRSSKP